MANKHTPGDWVLTRRQGKWFVLTKPDSEPFVGQVIAGQTTAPESMANLTLIAAAPKLLDAVDWLVGQLQGDSATGHSYWKQFPEYRAACDAIAKATGGAS